MQELAIKIHFPFGRILTNADSLRTVRPSSNFYVRTGFTERLDSLGFLWWAVGDSNFRPAD
jgi:hypothetical protein